MPRVPIPYHGTSPAQPYAIPTRGAVQGHIGTVPQIPQPGSQGFGAGHGNAGAAVGSHISQQSIGNFGSNFNFSASENPKTQPSVGGPLSQPGYVSNVSGNSSICIFFPLICVLL